ncbi:MAG: hypothetical protein PHZ13_12220 [bacterium]|nr:hypothetical protein [bacterium]
MDVRTAETECQRDYGSGGRSDPIDGSEEEGCTRIKQTTAPGNPYAKSGFHRRRSRRRVRLLRRGRPEQRAEEWGQHGITYIVIHRYNGFYCFWV